MSRRQQAERRGRFAESLVLVFLITKGYWPVARRAKTPLGEVDLIMRRGKTLALVEVKRRKTMDEALSAVLPRQQARILNAFSWWIARHPRYSGCHARCDVVALAPRRWPRHIHNAF